MILLLSVAFVSGLATILAPCIWPLLPAVLSASHGEGRLKPLGVSLGIITSFSLFTLLASLLVSLFHIDVSLFRLIAVIVIIGFGLSLLIPKLSLWMEILLSRLSRVARISGEKTGFSGGFVTGTALGLVWAPCAGPVLATIAVLASTRMLSFGAVQVTGAYAIGLGIPLFLFSFAGQRFFEKSRAITPFTGVIQKALGVIMILTGIFIYTGSDTLLQAKFLNLFPSYSSMLSNLEQIPAVKEQLDQLKRQLPSGKLLPVLGSAPEFVGITNWLNVDKALTMADLRGKVVLIDFWTYTCINCIRTLPYVTKWYDTYKDSGFVVVGVHSPEFEFEKSTENLKDAIKRFNIHYPVAQDNNFATWNAYKNNSWPSKYLIDAKGIVRYTHSGEGQYEETEQHIRELLMETGQDVSGMKSGLTNAAQTRRDQTPELYLGSAREEFEYMGSGNIPLHRFLFDGRWITGTQLRESVHHSTLKLHFSADTVYLVARSSDGSAKKIDVLLDGKLLDDSNAGADIHGGMLDIKESRAYEVINFHGNRGDHVLEFQLDPGVEVYTFTFG